jgi:hypothetical protein
VAEASLAQYGNVNASNYYANTGSNRQLTGGEAITLTVLGGVLGRYSGVSVALFNDGKGAVKELAPASVILQTETDSDGPV